MAMRKNSKLFLIISLPIIFLACLPGCMHNRTIEEDDESSKMPELISLRQKVDNLEKENKILTAEATVLKEDKKEISIRAKKLEDRCNNLQLEVERRTVQVELLQDLPDQRDKFKAELKKEKARADKLESELKKYRE